MHELINGVSCDLPFSVPFSELQSDCKRENCLIVDWFSFSVKFDFDSFARDLISKNNLLGYDSDIKDPSNDFVDYVSREFALDFIENILILEDPFISWLSVPGYYGFRHRLYFNGISVHFGGNSPRGLYDRILVEMSGTGCRTYDEWGCNSWAVLFSLCKNCPTEYHCTRLDVAYDDFTGVLDIHTLDHENELHNLTTTFRDYRLEKSYVKDDMCIYYGSMSSDIMFRCYNKAAERNRSDEIDHWIRFEIQLRDSRALAFIQSYLSTGSFGGTFSGIIDKCLRYVVPTGSDSNKSRWDTAPWWSDFIGETSIIQDFTKKNTEYNLMNLEKYVTQTSAAAIDTYIDIVGLKKFVSEVRKVQKKKLPIKYESLKQSHKLADDLWSSTDDLSEAFKLLEAAGYV